MKIVVLTIFPDLFNNFIEESLIKKAIERDLLKIEIVNIRDYAELPHKKVDDEIFGGGPGMLLKPEPLAQAIEATKNELPNAKVILLSASGIKFSQCMAEELATENNLILICGRYEGIDQRIIDLYVNLEISIGDYILLGGETPAMVLIEATARLCPGILGNPLSSEKESFSPLNKELKKDFHNLLEPAQYTRPAEFKGLKVPEVLLSGNHQAITKWQLESAKQKTLKSRPDLVKKYEK